MDQTQAERLQAERKKSENEFDITQYEHVPRRYYGRIFFATVIVIALAGLARAFAKWSSNLVPSKASVMIPLKSALSRVGPPLAALAKAGLDETAQIGLSCCGISVKRQKTSVSILICAGPWKR